MTQANDRFRVLLLRPDSGIEAAPPPLGLLYLAAWLRREDPGYSIRIMDGRIGGLTAEELFRRAEPFRPQAVGITALHADSAQAHALARRFKEGFPDVPVVIGGPYPSSEPAAALGDPNIDYAVVGEGERPFARLMASIARGERPGPITGVLDRLRPAPDGPVAPDFVEDLDGLPLPAWDLLDLAPYFSGRRRAMENPLQVHRQGASVMTSRGCPFACVFCHRIFGRRFRAHSPERVVEEVEVLVRRYGVREIEVLDDTFNFDLERAARILSLLVERGLSLPMSFSNGVRADRIDGPLLDLMKRAGVYRINFGVESAVPRVLRLMRKNLDPGAARGAIERTARRGILAGGFFMLGFPTETEEEMRRTIDFAVRSDLHTAVFALVTPYPGTDLYREAVGRGLVPSARFSTVNRVALNLSEVPDDRLVRLRREAYRRFYLRPGRAFRIARDAPSRRRLASNFFEVLRVAFLGKELYGGSERRGMGG